MKHTMIFAAALTFLGITLSASAATVTFTLDLFKLGSGNFELRAHTSAGDNGGLASYNVPLTNVATVNHNSLRNAAASSGDGGLEGPVGFTLLRTADDANASIVGPVAIFGSQDTITPTPFLIHGMGQTAGDLASRGISTAGSKEGDPWAADMVIAVGTYTPGVFPTFNQQASVPTLANVFNSASGWATSAATVQMAVITLDGSNSVMGGGGTSSTPPESPLHPAVEETTTPEPRHMKPSRVAELTSWMLNLPTLPPPPTSEILAFKESLLAFKESRQKHLPQPKMIAGTVTAIPEPTSWILIGIALPLLVRRRPIRQMI